MFIHENAMEETAFMSILLPACNVKRTDLLTEGMSRNRGLIFSYVQGYHPPDG